MSPLHLIELVAFCFGTPYLILFFANLAAEWRMKRLQARLQEEEEVSAAIHAWNLRQRAAFKEWHEKLYPGLWEMVEKAETEEVRTGRELRRLVRTRGVRYEDTSCFTV